MHLKCNYVVRVLSSTIGVLVLRCDLCVLCAVCVPSRYATCFATSNSEAITREMRKTTLFEQHAHTDCIDYNPNTSVHAITVDM